MIEDRTLPDEKSLEAFDEPTTCLVVDGEVVLTGPGGVDISMTPAAARETGRRLLAAADEAEHKHPEA